MFIRNPIFIILVLVACFLHYVNCSDSNGNAMPPKVENGQIDLRNWDFLNPDPINLTGDWEFYSGKFLAPEETVPRAQRQFLLVPGCWQNLGYSAYGFGTYKLRILLPSTFTLDQKSDLSLEMRSVGTSYTMYANGEKILNLGIVGATKESSIPYFKNKVVAIPNMAIVNYERQSDSQILDLVFHVSNFHHPQAGLWDNINLGQTDVVLNSKNKKQSFDLVVFGAFLIMGFYHLGYFLNRKKDASPLAFSIFSFLMAIRILSTEGRYITEMFPDLPFSFVHRLDFLTFYIGMLVFVLFVQYLFPAEIIKRLNQVIIGIIALASIPVFLFPMEYYTRTITVMQMLGLFVICYAFYILARAILNKRMGAQIFSVGFAIFGLSIVHDILRAMGLIVSLPMGQYGFLVFVFFQAFLLSSRFTSAFSESEKLSKELVELTQSLEEKVRKRTKDLETTNREIKKLTYMTHLVNSLSDLDEIFLELTEYFSDTYGIKASWLFLPDENTEYLYGYKAFSYIKVMQEIYDFTSSIRVPLTEDGGILSIVFKRKKSLYLPRIPRSVSTIDKLFLDKFNPKSFLYVPLVRLNRCIGILIFSNLDEPLILSKKNIKNISNFCSQISGSIDMNRLLKQIEKEKQNAINFQKETDKQKLNAIELNHLIRSLNENLNIQEIMNKVSQFIKKKYGFKYHGLIMLEKDSEVYHSHEMTVPDFVTQKEIQEIREIRFPMEAKISVHALAMKSKKAVYLKKVKTSLMNEAEVLLKNVLKFESIMILPLIVENQLIGFLDLYNLGEIHASKEDILNLSNLGDQLAGVINGSNLFKEVQEKTSKLNNSMKSIKRDHSVAKKIQENMLFINPEVSEKLNVVPLYVPMSEVGGDFYDVEKLSENKFRIFLSDATGHGVQGALITMAIKGIYDNIKHYEMDADQILEIFNNEFLGKYNSLNSLLSAILIDIDVQSETLTYASAGHPAGLLLTNGSSELLEKTGKLIGVAKNVKYRSVTFPFKKDYRLHVFTDGFFEEFDAADVEFGEDKLRALLHTNFSLSLESSHENILAELAAFSSGKKFEDDITALGIEYSGTR
jgi:serine phosphatase RsbU (regulator of sigma subunit)/GAF domain-containing protein